MLTAFFFGLSHAQPVPVVPRLADPIEHITLLVSVATILVPPEPSRYRREGAQDNDEAGACCNFGGKHANQDQKPGDHDYTKQHNKSVRRLLKYHCISYQYD
jgi:hypothetical protein